MLRRRRRGFTIQVTVSGDEAGRTFTLPLNNGDGSTFDCIVDWGDGTQSTITAYDDADRAHIYAVGGTYVIEIRGTCEGWSFNNGGDKAKIRKILFWGDRPTFAGFKYLVGAFYGCANCASLGYEKILVSGAGPTSLLNAFREAKFSGPLPAGFLDHCTDVTSLSSCFANNQFSGPLPAGFLDHCTDVTDLGACFARNQFSGPLPAGFLDHCTDVTNLGYCFASNQQLQLSEYCCYADGEQATRFLGKTMNFTSMFARSGAYTGAQGTAPDLWNCDFGETITLDVAPAVDWAGGDTITGQTSGATAVVVAKVSALVYKIKKHFGTFTLGEVVGVTGVADKLADQGEANPTFAGTPVSTGCFSGHTIATVSNYADIPASWK